MGKGILGWEKLGVIQDERREKHVGFGFWELQYIFKRARIYETMAVVLFSKWNRYFPSCFSLCWYTFQIQLFFFLLYYFTFLHSLMWSCFFPLPSLSCQIFYCHHGSKSSNIVKRGHSIYILWKKKIINNLNALNWTRVVLSY